MPVCENKDDLFKLAVSMIKVTPENFTKVDPEMILYLCKVLETAENHVHDQSIYAGLSVEEIKERMAF